MRDFHQLEVVGRCSRKQKVGGNLKKCVTFVIGHPGKLKGRPSTKVLFEMQFLLGNGIFLGLIIQIPPHK